MLGRLFIGIIKGLFVGGLLGFGLTQLGIIAPGLFLAYPAAAIVGVLIGLIAGKPIWAGDAKIEAGLKAFVGALLGVGLMFAARTWLRMPVPLQITGLTGASSMIGITACESGLALNGIGVFLVRNQAARSPISEAPASAPV